MRGGKRENSGRPKGSSNKDLKTLRTRIESLLDEQWDNVINDFEELSAKERIDTIIKLLEYALPKLNRTEIESITSIEDFVEMTPQERQERIRVLQNKLNNN
ncbi:hypothetical protein [Maribacter sp. ACAM166]|uniref:hypothetical protein n=1 Tax=Maribacter sp. ACAM166 TaxID=2508996 RepID=UPI0010FE3DCA|nr:hypothetical protein [Maribacter sp. ACAM166]TLP75699.1 hypothetical protein ES765_14760 [Maribacter sp. ACAM166]